MLIILSWARCFRFLPLRAALIGAYMLLAVAVAAQTKVDTLLGQARTAEKGGDYARKRV